MKNWWLFFFLVINLSALLWGLSALKFSLTWVRRKAPPGPPQIWKKVLFFSHFGLKLKNWLSDCFLISHVHRYGWEDSWKARIGLLWSLKTPSGPPKYPKNIHFFYILAHKWKNGFQIVSPCCTYVSTVMRSAFADILVPLVPLDFM